MHQLPTGSNTKDRVFSLFISSGFKYKMLTKTWLVLKYHNKLGCKSCKWCWSQRLGWKRTQILCRVGSWRGPGLHTHTLTMQTLWKKCKTMHPPVVAGGGGGADAATLSQWCSQHHCVSAHKDMDQDRCSHGAATPDSLLWEPGSHQGPMSSFFMLQAVTRWQGWTHIWSSVTVAHVPQFCSWTSLMRRKIDSD